MLALGSAGGPWSGSETSWRDVPPSSMIIYVLGGMLLVCLGVLLGSAWTIQALQPKLRQQADERRKLNEEWRMVRTAQRR
jgi:hypothetical protein